MTFTYNDLNTRYEEFTAMLRCECTLTTELVGGLPAEESAVRQYVRWHLGIAEEAVDPETGVVSPNPEYEQAVQRIMKHEVEPSTPPEGELPEGKLYGLRVIRKSEKDHWPYLLDHMVKAALKTAASRMAIFTQVSGTKGAFTEAGRVRAHGISLHDPTHPNHIFLLNPSGDGPAETYFKEFMGRVSTPQGLMSIIHRSECVPEGSRFNFEFRFVPVANLTEAAVRDALATLMQVGVGSARALERGKFRIDFGEVDLNKPYQAKPPAEKKEKDKEKDKDKKKGKQEAIVEPEPELTVGFRR